MSLVNITGNLRRGFAWQDAKSPECSAKPEWLARFEAKVARGREGECWRWTSATLGRYGGFFLHRRPQYAHRLAYTLAYGPIPDGLFVCHTCDNTLCVNPAHLFVGDQFDNMQDASRKGRLSGPRRGHRRRKLTDEQCDAIEARALAGEVQADLAREYGVSRTLISLLVSGRRRQYRKAS